MRHKIVIAIARKDLEMLARDPVFPVLLVIMPIVVTSVIGQTLGHVLKSQGYVHASGAEQAVPGIAAIFAIFMVGYGGQSFMREHIWATWPRLRAMAIRPAEIMVGKVLPILLVLCIQQIVLFAAGFALFGLRVPGSVVALLIVDGLYAVWVVTFVLATVTFCRTFQQVLAVSNLGAMTLGALGGALTSIAALPVWARAISPATPTYWAMTGFNEVLLRGRGITSVLPTVAVLAGSATVIAALVAWRFRFSAEKTGTVT
jgi:ABC-2 type transport system permease protein